MPVLTPETRDRLLAPPGGPRWLPSIDDEVSVRRLWRAIMAVLAAGVVAFLVRGADRPADPVVRPGAVAEAAIGVTPPPHTP